MAKRTEQESEIIFDDFLDRLRSQTTDYDQLLQGKSDEPLPDDVIAELARQRALALPLLQKYHLLHEKTPTLAMARAARQEELDFMADVFTGMDLTDLDDDSDVPPEFVCPKCRFKWSGDPNGSVDQGQRIFIPTGRVNTRKGRLSLDVVGVPLKGR